VRCCTLGALYAGRHATTRLASYLAVRLRRDDAVANNRPKPHTAARGFELFDADVDDQVHEWVGSAGSALRSEPEPEPEPDSFDDETEDIEVVADIASHGQQ
jgi:hypothetical protein